jgi:Tfp pilus assembly protein PilV
MKKIITVVAFFAITLLGTTNAVAQESNSRRVSNEAQEFTQQLVQEFNINKEQQRDVNNAYMYKQRRVKGINENSSRTALKTINLEFDTKLKTILTDVQYKKYALKKN